MRMPSICPQMPNVELKGALSGVLFLFIAGGFGGNVNKNRRFIRVFTWRCERHGAKQHFELRRCARETA